MKAMLAVLLAVVVCMCLGQEGPEGSRKESGVEKGAEGNHNEGADRGQGEAAHKEGADRGQGEAAHKEGADRGLSETNHTEGGDRAHEGGEGGEGEGESSKALKVVVGVCIGVLSVVLCAAGGYAAKCYMDKKSAASASVANAPTELTPKSKEVELIVAVDSSLQEQ